MGKAKSDFHCDFTSEIWGEIILQQQVKKYRQ